MFSGPRDGDAVVIPAVQSPHAVTCLRSLGRRGVRTIAAYERPTPAFRSRYVDERLLLPSPYEELGAYARAMCSLAARPDVRAIVPMREVDSYVLARHRAALAEHLRPLWPSFEALETTHDRLALVDVASDVGVAVPETAPLDAVTDWEPTQVIKARYALLVDDYVPAADPDSTAIPMAVEFLAPGEAPDRRAIVDEFHHVPIVQQYVPGEEYALWALYDDGEAVATCGKRQVRGESYAGGTSVYRETVRDPALEDAGTAILDRLAWDGFASVQFKRDARTGAYTLLEVNPRLWVSAACPVAAGVDFPYYFWRVATGGPSPEQPAYPDGVGTHRLGGELQYLASVLRSGDAPAEPPPIGTATRDVLGSLVRQPRSDYFALEDPAPFVRDVLEKLSQRLGP